MTDELKLIGKQLGVCHCALGFEYDNDGICVDIDECAVENNCPNHSKGIHRQCDIRYESYHLIDRHAP